MRQRPMLAAVALMGCAALPPTHDPEGCDHVTESAKRAGSDLVVDGDLYCATSNGDCELTPARIVAGKALRRVTGGRIPVHILRKEAGEYDKELTERNEISFCFPAELWFPSAGHHRGRFYLREEAGQQYHMAFYPRVKE